MHLFIYLLIFSYYFFKLHNKDYLFAEFSILLDDVYWIIGLCFTILVLIIF